MSENKNLLPQLKGMPSINMSNPGQNAFWKRAWLAIGMMLKEAEDNKQELSPMQAFSRSVQHFKQLENQLPDGRNNQPAIVEGKE